MTVMTQAAALEKRCPLKSPANPGANADCHCDGENCMWWRRTGDGQGGCAAALGGMDTAALVTAIATINVGGGIG